MSRSNFSRRNSALNTSLIMKIVLGVVVLGGAAFGIRILIAHKGNMVPAVYGDVAELSLLTRKMLIHKVSTLETKITSYDAQVSELALLRDENNKLKAELGRDEADKGALAHVLTLQNRSFYDTFVIDAGTAEGIMEGQTVYAFDSVALGTIARADDHSSIVSLYSAPGRETAGTAQGTDVAVTLTGRGNGEYEVRMPRDVHFDIGSMIAYQSMQTSVIAQIERIVGDPRDPFQRLLAKAPVNLQALKWVIVK